VDVIKFSALPEAFEDEGIKSFTTTDGYRVTVSQLLRASCNKDHKFEAYQWLRENGFENIVTETVNAGTLSSVARMLLEGTDPDAEVHELPDELFNVNITPTTSVTKTK